MLKITSRNEKLKRRMTQKETNYLFYKIFRCFFVFLRKPNLSFRKPKVSPSSKHAKTFYKTKKKTKNFFFSKRQISLSHCQRYCLNWQSKLLFNSSFTKTRTICLLTGRSRSVYRAFRLSRLKIRTFAAAGYFVGLSKASW